MDRFSSSPHFNVAYNQDGSDECTIVVSNAGHPECESNLVSDKGSVTTQFSTDVKNKSDVEDAKTKIPTGIFILQHVLPWGGNSTNTTAAKWKWRMKERAK